MFATVALPQSFRLSLPSAGIAASLVLHAALLALIVLAHLGSPIDAPTIESVQVELISMAQFLALQPQPAPSPQHGPPVPVPVGNEPVAPPNPLASESGPFTATDFYAGSILAEPESARLRRAMRTLVASEQVVQLCDIEAMEQVRRARPDYDPDMVVPYAMAEMDTRNGTLVAMGGAFRSRREWYELRFSCTPAADLSQVEAFEFTLGEPIPHNLWEEHFLTAEESDE